MDWSRRSAEVSRPALKILHFLRQIFPVAGLEILNAGMDHPVLDSHHPVLILCDAVEGEHGKDGLIVKFLKGHKDIFPAGMVSVFPGSAGPSEDHKQPAGSRPQGIDGAAVVYKKWAGMLSFVAHQLRLQRLAERALQHFDGVPVDTGQLQGIYRDISVGPAAVAASLAAGDRAVPLPLGPLYGYGRAFVEHGESIEEQGKPWIHLLGLRKAQARRSGDVVFLMGFLHPMSCFHQ